MSVNRDVMRLYLVTDRSWLHGRTLESQVEEAILGGVTLVQLREKHTTGEELLALAQRVKKVTDRYDVPLIINDYVDIALQIDAAGVHLGQSDDDIRMAREKLGMNKIIGASTKGDAGKISLETLTKVAKCVPIPVVAIGGIDEDNAAALRGRNLAGIAVVSAILAQPDVRKAAQMMRIQADEISK